MLYGLEIIRSYNFKLLLLQSISIWHNKYTFKYILEGLKDKNADICLNFLY